MDFKKAYDSVLHNILIEFGVPMKPVRLIKMSLNKTYSKVHIGKHLSDNFPIQKGLKHDDALLSLLCFRICHQQGPEKPGGTEIKLDISAAGLC
jgi:hypothetical protein